jgi:hypothetical protein
MKHLVYSLLLLLVSAGSLPCHGQSFELIPDLEDTCPLIDVNGVSVADYDLDGDLDIFVVSIHRYEVGNDQTWSRLLRNDGNLGFVDVTHQANLFNQNESLRSGWMGDRMSASWGDYDNDGYPDLFLANDGSDELWHNDGNGKFSRVTQRAGVQGCDDCYSSNGLWWDYDLDGDLDLYVSDWAKANRQYRNEGDGTFTDVSEILALNDTSKTWASIPIDVNKDLLPDLYVVNDFGDNFLFINNQGKAFTEATAAYGLEDDGDGMGVDIGDFNNDGNFDIYITNIYRHRPNPLFVGSDQGVFTELAGPLGVEDTGWGWGARFFDADHDRDEDLYVVNGMNLSAGRGDRNTFFENTDGHFNNISDILGVNSAVQARGLEVFDYDLDGDLDMLVGNRESSLGFYKNTTMENQPEGSNWIQIILEGTESNRSGFGSVVEINCDGNRYYRHFSGANLMGQSLKPVHFGLGDHTEVTEIAVIWPSGVKEFFPTAQANQQVKLTEGTGALASAFIVTSVNEPKENKSLNIFPNPFSDRISIDLNNDTLGQIQFKLINTFGQVVFQDARTVHSQRQLELYPPSSSIVPGVYYYQLEFDSGSSYGKILKR